MIRTRTDMGFHIHIGEEGTLGLLIETPDMPKARLKTTRRKAAKLIVRQFDVSLLYRIRAGIGALQALTASPRKLIDIAERFVGDRVFIYVGDWPGIGGNAVDLKPVTATTNPEPVTSNGDDMFI